GATAPESGTQSGPLASAFPKQPSAPRNLSLALPRHMSAFASGVFPGVSAFWWHLRSESTFFDTHLFLATRHLLCTPAACAPSPMSAAPRKAARINDVRVLVMSVPPSRPHLSRGCP